MESFEYQSNPARIIFGSGTVNQVPDELAKVGLEKPLILCTPRQISKAEALQDILKGKIAGIFPQATMHTPVEVTEKAIAEVEVSGCDSIISIGGGSTVGLGKAISIRTGLYHLSIPTTYAGSEVTPHLGETKDGRKTTRFDPKILPGTVIYDVDLTLTLSLGLTATSGINAIAHAVEALYAKNKNPITSMIAQKGIKALAAALPDVLKDPSSREARSRALYGAWLCGSCLGSVGMALHHKLCHTLGGSFGLPHAETHTAVLPHALAYNAPEIPQVIHLLAECLPDSEGDAIKGLNRLLEKLCVERGLKAFGMEEEGIPKAAEIAVSNPYWNPRKVERDLIQEVIRRAWAGESARVDL